MKCYTCLSRSIAWFTPNFQPKSRFFDKKMVGNMLIKDFVIILNNMGLFMKHLAPELHNKMVFLIKKIDISLKLLRPC